MSEKKRRLFQIHLSTAIVMMFVAGGLVRANTAARIFAYSEGKDPWFANGWPITFLEKLEDGSEWRQIFWSALYADIAISVLILGTVAFVCERLTRREARKP